MTITSHRATESRKFSAVTGPPPGPSPPTVLPRPSSSGPPPGPQCASGRRTESMSGYSAVILEATRLLCGHRGSMLLPQLHEELRERCGVTEEGLCGMVCGCSRFLLVRGPERDGRLRPEDCAVVAQTSLRLCRNYVRGEPCGGCGELHLCKFFIYGTCRFGKGRKPCKFSHDLLSGHNYELLRDYQLHELKEDELFLLLLQNDPALLPEVCLHYNKGSGPHGDCTFQSRCTKVHLCQHFIQGGCIFGTKCRRQHTIDKDSCRILEERGLSREIINDLPFIYGNVHQLRAAAAAEKIPDSSSNPPQKDEICLHFFRNSCRFQKKCHQIHFHLPYKWEVLDGCTWRDLQHMEDIERDYCDPSKTESACNQPINFITMTRGSQPVRRLSTVSSVKKPPYYSLTTEWLWYYKGDRGNWVEYGQLDDKQRSTSETSRTLEEKYLFDRKAEVKVVKGQKEYTISFKDMYQRNPKHNTKRRVCRRPRFVSWDEVEDQVALFRNQMCSDVV